MKQIIAWLIFVCFFNSGIAQTFTTRTGLIGFYSKTPFEDIKAENNQVYAAIDLTHKQIALVLLLKGFLFTKELMQEHFNENYVESDKYPKASFSGNIIGFGNTSSDSLYNVQIKGNLTLHNVTKEIDIPATLEKKSGKILGLAEFKLQPEDFNIHVPSNVREKIAKEIKVKVNLICNP